MRMGNGSTFAGSGRIAGLPIARLPIALAMVVGATACTFDPGGSVLETPEGVYRVLNSAPYVSTTESDRWPVTQTSGFKSEHGYACAKASKAASKEYLGLRIEESAVVPPGHEATVFLNGWRLGYTSKDHHVIGLGSTIFNVERATVDGRDLLRWDAGGLLSDRKGDDGYEWCYFYTLLYWKPSRLGLDVEAVVSSASNRLIFIDEGRTKSVYSIPGTFSSSDVRPVVPLLMGFGQSWSDDDHHVLQTGFDFGDVSRSGETISWTSDSILKDNSSFRRAHHAAVVSILGGRSVKEWSPRAVLVADPKGGAPVERSNRLILRPRSKSSCPNIGSTSVHRDEVIIEDVPFHSAVPMLVGWELRDICEDHHVKRAGAWIRDFRVEPNADGETSTIRLTVEGVLVDKQGWFGSRGSAARYEIRILGFEGSPFAVQAPLTGRVLAPGTSAPTPGPTPVPTPGDDEGVELRREPRKVSPESEVFELRRPDLRDPRTSPSGGEVFE